jgi:hypothetical protein
VCIKYPRTGGCPDARLPVPYHQLISLEVSGGWYWCLVIA